MKKPINKELKYSKDAILKSQKFIEHRDFLSAMLKDNKMYTLSELERILKYERH